MREFLIEEKACFRSIGYNCPAHIAFLPENVPDKDKHRAIHVLEAAPVLSLLREMKEALEWIADKKSDSSGAHSTRSERTAKEALEKLEKSWLLK